MKTVKFINRFLSVLCIAALVLSCSPEDGVDGMDGADGIDGTNGTNGADGADGAQGEQGEQGETGTANVIYSDWIPVDYLLDGALESNLQGLGTFTASELNRDTDVVLVYGQRDTDSAADGVYALPYILASQNEYYSFILADASSSTTSLRATVNTLDGGTNLFNFFQQYRYVIIPGGQSESGNTGPGGLGSKNSTLDYTKMSYGELTAHFNIPE